MKSIFNTLSLLLMINLLFTSCGKEAEKLPDNPNRKDYSDGDYYIGPLDENGEPNGKGTYYWADGCKYEGDFVHGKLTGKGIKYNPKGIKDFEGDWVDGDLTGKGIIYNDDGSKFYEGDIVKFVPSGKGIMYWSNGDKYDGDFVNGNRTGKGTYYWASGDKYEGDFVNGELNGKGTYYWTNGNKYEGDFVKGDRTGKGIFYWKNGDKYEGDFVAGARTGTGKMTWKDNTAITCQWDNGTPVNVNNQTFAIWAIKFWYYWNNQVGLINPDYYQSASAVLGAVKYKDDNSSAVYGIDTPTNIFFYGKQIGYGLGIRWYSANDLRVSYVYPNSPAARQGIVRGDKIMEINGVAASSQNTGSIFTDEIGKSVTLSVGSDNETAGAIKLSTITLVSEKYDITSVLYKEVIQTPSKKVGYLVLKSFIEANEPEIKNAITTLADGNIQDLILDLRYCAGGNYEVLRKTASLMVPTGANGKVFLTRKYNQDRQSSSEDYIFEKSNSLNLSRMIILTSNGTYNLGEYLIVGLQPYCNVVLLGAKTDGTAGYASSSWTLPDKKEILSLTTALFENSAGKNSTGGLEPNYTVADGLDKNWGDRQENLLKNALYFIENGQVLKSSSLRSQFSLPVIPEANSPVESLPVAEEIINSLK